MSLFPKNLKILNSGYLTKKSPDASWTPCKEEKNLTGLRNQGPHIGDPLKSISEFVEQERHTTVGVDGDGVVGDEVDDSHHPDLKDMVSSKNKDDLDSDFESDHEWKGLMSKELGEKLAALSCKIDKDQTDLDWIPYKLRPKKGE